MKSRNVYGIRNKITKEPWETYKGKWCWQGIGHAKNAFINGTPYGKYRAGCFDLEDFEFEVVKLGELIWEPLTSEDK